MNQQQKQHALNIWQRYIQAKKNLRNQHGVQYDYDEFVIDRLESIQEISALIQGYISGRILLGQFKTQNDSCNKRIHFWGFQGVNGQMFFNLLANSSRKMEKWDELDALLKQCIPLPPTLIEAADRMDDLMFYVNTLAKGITDRHQVPRSGSVGFFLSYFWHIQSHDYFPLYFSGNINTLQKENIWWPGDRVSDSYVSFHQVNHELVDLFSQVPTKQAPDLWEVEHAFWHASLGDLPALDEKFQLISAIPKAVHRDPDIGHWDQCQCAVCDKRLFGFDLDQHTLSAHHGVEPGYRKV